MVEGIETCENIDAQAGVEYYNGILMPDLVDAHCHLELSYLRDAIPQGGGFTAFARDMGRVRDIADRTEKLRAAEDADRALGSLVSTVSHRDICYGVAIENNTGQVITTLQVSYTGEMWRAGSDPAAVQQLTFAYGKRTDNHSLRDREEWIGELDGLTPVDSLSFRSPAGNTAAEAATPNTAINGNDPRNRTRVDGSIELNLEPGAVAILRWEDADDSGSDHALAIDDLCLRATLAPASGLPPAHVTGTMLYTRDRTVVFSHTPRTAVQVYDAAGRCLYNRQPHTPVLDLSAIATHGLYIICMERGRFGPSGGSVAFVRRAAVDGRSG